MVTKLADLMVKTNPELYRPFVNQDKSGRPILYVRLQKALYSLLKSALLFYKQLVTDLTNIGSTLNPYDPCVANKMFNRKQLTIAWHVDNLTYSHVQQLVIDDFVNILKQFFGDKINKVHTGRIHDYSVSLSIIPMITKPSFSWIILFTRSSLSYPRRLWEPLPLHQPTTYSKFVQKVVNSSLASRPSIFAIPWHNFFLQVLVSDVMFKLFLLSILLASRTQMKMTGVNSSESSATSILRGKCTSRYPLTPCLLFAGIDGSHQIHANCHGHTGALMTQGGGTICSSSCKQKLTLKAPPKPNLSSLTINSQTSSG